MERRYLFAAIISLALITICFSYFDLVRSFSDIYMWWDSLEHFLGGVTVGFASLFALSLLSRAHHGGLAVFSVLCVGIAWEIMEVHYGLGSSRWMGYWADTIKDIICDCVGGYVAVRIGMYIHKI